MPFDASGNFTRLRGADSWKGDASAGTRIKSDLHDTNDNDLAAGLSQTITKNGATQPTADIPMAGHKLINLGEPVTDSDAATKHYVDHISTFSTSLSLPGSDLNGRINFTGSGVTGLGFTAADLSWLARPVQLAADNVTVQRLPRLVLNDKADGSGTDKISINDIGMIATPWLVSPNTAYDGTNWRTISAGYVSGLGPGNSAINLWGNDTATVNPYQIAPVRNYATLGGAGGHGILTLYKSGATGTVARLAGMKTGSGLYRWLLDLANATAEGGSNTGSDFSIYRYSDTGTNLGTPLTITRASGAWSVGSAVGNYTLSVNSPIGYGAVIGYSANTSYYGICGYYTSGGVGYSFYGNGSAYNSSAWTTSDGRAKDNIAACDIAAAYSQVRAVPVLTYTKKATTTPEVGWLAQDIEPIVPAAVMDVEIPPNDTDTRAMIGGGDTIKATNDRTMLATLWAAFQHQATIIEALQARIAALEAP